MLSLKHRFIVWINHYRQFSVREAPHIITLVLALFSPFLSVLALFVSLQGLSISRKAAISNELTTKTNQRAYLSIEEGSISFHKASLIKKVQFGRSILAVNIRMKILNSGNTPATITKVNLSYIYPKDWNPFQTDAFDDLKQVPPKHSVDWLEALLVSLTDDQMALYEKQRDFAKAHPELRETFISDTLIPVRERLFVKGELEYRDIFDGLHSQKWCWKEPPVGSEGSVSNCSPETLYYSSGFPGLDLRPYTLTGKGDKSDWFLTERPKRWQGVP